MELYFIINPAAKNGLSMRIWQKLEWQLKQEQISYQVYFTKYAGDGRETVRKILGKVKEKLLIIAVGGDGTIHEIINGVYPYTHGVIGYIPAGSGNDFSRGFHIAKQPRKALKQIIQLLANHKKPTSRLVDCGSFKIGNLETEYFINNLGLGFDAAVAKSVNESKVKEIFNRIRLGKLVYVFILIKELFVFKPADLSITIDNHEKMFRKAWFATISNHPYIGGGLKLSPSSIPNDGLLDLTIVHDISRWKILLLFITVFWGGHTKIKGVYFTKGKNIFVETCKNLPIHADGEYKGVGNIVIQINENSIPILDNNKIKMQQQSRPE